VRLLKAGTVTQSFAPNSLKIIPQEEKGDKSEQNVRQWASFMANYHIQHPKAANGRGTKNQRQRKDKQWWGRDRRSARNKPECESSRGNGYNCPEEHLHHWSTPHLLFFAAISRDFFELKLNSKPNISWPPNETSLDGSKPDSPVVRFWSYPRAFQDHSRIPPPKESPGAVSFFPSKPNNPALASSFDPV
jgi:hypothetical protein